MFSPAIKLHLVWGFTSWSRFITGGYLICNYLGCHMSSGCKSPVEWWFCGFISWRISINQSVQCRGTVFEHCEAMESRNSRVRVVAMIARHGDSESFLLLMLTKNWLSGFGFHIFSHIFYFLWGVETANTYTASNSLFLNLLDYKGMAYLPILFVFVSHLYMFHMLYYIWYMYIHIRSHPHGMDTPTISLDCRVRSHNWRQPQTAFDFQEPI